MTFVKSNSMKVSVLAEQEKQLSSEEKMRSGLRDQDVIAYDIYDEDLLVGFVMLREWESGCFFLWNYAIDSKYQNRHYGTMALKELITLLRTERNMKCITTTYIAGNEHAKHVYEKVGFTITDIVNEDDCHEINMIYPCK